MRVLKLSKFILNTMDSGGGGKLDMENVALKVPRKKNSHKRGFFSVLLGTNKTISNGRKAKDLRAEYSRIMEGYSKVETKPTKTTKVIALPQLAVDLCLKSK